MNVYELIINSQIEHRLLNHSNIIKCFELIYSSNNNEVCYSMEYGGVDLLSLVQYNTCNLSLEQIHYIISEITKGVLYLHSNNLIHKYKYILFLIFRDIKTSNILYNSNSVIKICDFGIYIVLFKIENCNSDITIPLKCTLNYSSPEIVIFPNSEYTNKIDIWGIGLIYVELLLDDVLFNVNSEFDLIDEILNLIGKPSPDSYPEFFTTIYRSFCEKDIVPSLSNRIREKRRNISEDEITFIKRILSFNPKDRLTAEEILDSNIIKNH